MRAEQLWYWLGVTAGSLLLLTLAIVIIISIFVAVIAGIGKLYDKTREVYHNRNKSRSGEDSRY